MKTTTRASALPTSASRRRLLQSLPAWLVLPGCAHQNSPPQDLLARGLDGWEVWMGVPHTSVRGLPAGTYQADRPQQGPPMGLGADPRGVFKVIEENGENVLRVSGEIFAGLSTRAEFQDYHLSLEFRWGEPRFAPRDGAVRDSGLLYHAQGAHGAFWHSWLASVEFQIQEGDVGDLHLLSGPRATVRQRPAPNGRGPGTWAAGRAPVTGGGHVRRALDHEFQHALWNRLDLYCVGARAMHVVNGHLALAIDALTDAQGQPLTRGRLQLQSEGAECHWRRLKLRPIREFPLALSQAAGWGTGAA